MKLWQNSAANSVFSWSVANQAHAPTRIMTGSENGTARHQNVPVRYMKLLYFQTKNYSLVEIFCPTLAAPTNGIFNVNEGSSLADINSFKCNDGFNMEGERKLTCLDADNDGKGEWTAVPPTCRRMWLSVFFLNTEYLQNLQNISCIEIVCEPKLVVPAKGSVDCSEGIKYGSTCVFQCSFGYFLEGDETSVCEDNDGDGVGTWSHPHPVCVGESVVTTSWFMLKHVYIW